ncbi:Hypothetical Protein U712_13115 [Bacillus subtilis PY79]|nr:Hypothetical Protein U712_13115 [Bacillus subtilis PY79]EME05910.1 hypothetical protein BS732_3210 [Bacillus subtilis MB73/2]KZD84671.1 hypothetical protein B4417_0746 [Bacillus subtilis]
MFFFCSFTMIRTYSNHFYSKPLQMTTFFRFIVGLFPTM